MAELISGKTLAAKLKAEAAAEAAELREQGVHARLAVDSRGREPGQQDVCGGARRRTAPSAASTPSSPSRLPDETTEAAASGANRAR